MNSGFDQLQDLELQIQAMSRTESPAELFKVIRDACRMAAPRGSVFLVRQGKINGWAAFGYDPEVNDAQRGFSCSLDADWLGALATSEETAGARPTDDATGPDFGQPKAVETVCSVIRIRDKPIALLVAERDENESPWHPEVNGLLVTMAQLRLELDLALRKMQSMQTTTQPPVKIEETPTSAVQPPPAKTPAPVKMSLEPMALPETEEPTETEEAIELDPVSQNQGQDRPELEAARRYARLVATDIRLYNEEAVVLGRRNGDLDSRLEEHLGRGKETFLRRHSDLGSIGLDLLHEAYVQVLAAGDDKLIPPSVLA